MGYNLTAEMFSEWAVGLVVVAVRLYARFSVDRGIFRWDDFCLVLGTVSLTPIDGLVVEAGLMQVSVLDILDVAGCVPVPMYRSVTQSPSVAIGQAGTHYND